MDNNSSLLPIIPPTLTVSHNPNQLDLTSVCFKNSKAQDRTKHGFLDLLPHHPSPWAIGNIKSNEAQSIQLVADSSSSFSSSMPITGLSQDLFNEKPIDPDLTSGESLRKKAKEEPLQNQDLKVV
ncbi:hypothetical protein VKT23_015736 [Stygiomarasmius scandens]|uniref:Prolactin receptor n=1 Tax=Marasmiellus scandens TaxID=2682957 RepID=A0ABR1IX47_9AGAR